MKKTLFIFLAAILFSSCVKELIDTIDKAQNVDAVKWNPSIAIPLVYSKIAVRDFIGQLSGLSFLKVEDDGGLTIVYSNEYESKRAEDLITLTDQDFSSTYTLSASEINTLSTTGNLTINTSALFNYDLGSSEMDRVLYKGGTAAFAVSSTLQHDIKCTISLNEGKKSGLPLAAVMQTSYSLGNPNSASENVDLDGYNVDYTKTTAGTSQIEASIKFEITKKGSNAVLPIETITFDLDLVNQKFKEIVGYLGSFDFSNDVDTLEIPFFDNEGQGSFTLADPRITLNLKNSIGVPVDARLLQFYGTNKTGNKVDLTGVPSPLPIPSLSLSEIGLTKTSKVVLNKSTSNLADFVNNQLNKIVYEFKVEANAVGPSVRNFFIDDSRIGGSLEIEIPIHGTARDFVVEVDQPFEFDLEGVDEIEEVKLRLYTENSFPIGVSVQAYFRDSVANTTIDSLIGADQLILPAGNVDATGIVTSANPKTTDIVLTGAQAERIKPANQVRIVVRLNTTFEGTNQPNVRFMLENNVLVQLGVQASALINQKF
ncbi:MAG: hypothetical protein RLZZ337_906 [Bacteroidota bacterium]|jgi:hypothetical protein